MKPYPDNPPVDEKEIAKLKKDLEKELEKSKKETLRREELMFEPRRKLLETGPPLPNVEEALKCNCTCHPRPADPMLHNGGTTCGCQYTEEENKIRTEKTLKSLRKIWKNNNFDSDELFTKAKEYSDSLNIKLDSYGGVAPFVITGNIDGYNFYLRERHGYYRIVVAGEDDPHSDVWRDQPVDALVVGEGSEHELGSTYEDVETSISLIANTIRTFLAQKECSHILGNNYCPSCGKSLKP